MGFKAVFSAGTSFNLNSVHLLLEALTGLKSYCSHQQETR
jgi:hypothetical protein